MNVEAVDQTLKNIKEINYPSSWENAVDEETKEVHEPEFISQVMRPMLAQKGDSLPVSAFEPDGVFPIATTQFEKRGVAINVPEWIVDNCIQCTRCSFVCPHAAIIPILADKEDLQGAPKTFKTKPAIGKEVKEKGYQYRIQVNTLDCLGCDNCVDVCPAKKKALVMKPLESQTPDQIPNYLFSKFFSKFFGFCRKSFF